MKTHKFITSPLRREREAGRERDAVARQRGTEARRHTLAAFALREREGKRGGRAIHAVRTQFRRGRRMEGDGDGVIAGTIATKEPPLPAPPGFPAHPSHGSAVARTAGDADAGVARAPSTVAGLAREAGHLFHARSYQGCLLILHQLQLQNEEDPKVRHNIAVAEYYRDGCTNPGKVLEMLAQVKARNEELVRAAEEQQEGNNAASTSGSTSGSGGNAGLSSASRTNSADTVAYMEDYDTSVPCVNNALMLYNLQRYADAMAVVEPLYRNIEIIDEQPSLQVCLLMLDVTLASGQPRKAAEVLQYMERVFAYLLPAVGTPTTAASVRSSTPSETEALMTSTEQTLARTSSDELLEEDALSLGSLEIDSSQNLGSRASIRPTFAAMEKPIPQVDVKPLLHLYRGRLFLSALNLKAAKREIKTALIYSQEENMTALLLKAQLEYSRGNYRKAIKLLTMCIGRGDSAMRGMVLNNLGCVHHRMRKDKVSALYFTKGLHAFSERSGPLSVSSFSRDKSLAIVYNAGLQQLSCGNPVLASSCFQEAAALYYNRPLLWLRLAECCIVALENGLLENTTTRPREIKVTAVGEGAWRRIVLPGGSLNPTIAHDLKLDEPEGDVQIPDNGENLFVRGKPHKLSLSFAVQCLQTAIHLFDRCDAKAAEAAAEATVASAEVKDGDESQSSKGGGSSTTGGGSSSTGDSKDSKGLLAAVSAIEEQKTQETAALRMWALAAISYCLLGVGHSLRALRSANELLRQPACARPYLLLGHVYAAEALCQLGRPQEALDHLSTCLNETTAETATAGTEDESQLKWKSGDHSEGSGDGDDSAAFNVGALGDAASVARLTGTSARALLYANLAATYAMQGNLQDAQQLSQQALSMTPMNPTTLLAAVFVEMKLEHTEAALALLKQHRHLFVVSSNKGLSQHD